MIHTATLTYRPTAELYREFRARTHFDPALNQWVCSTYSTQGITIYAYFTWREFRGDVFACRVNFHKLVDPSDRITVYSNADFSSMIERFNQIMDELGGLPHFEEWYARRIDYCVNVKTPYVSEYIRLLQKGDKPYSQALAYDKNAHHRTRKDGSAYYPSVAHDRRKGKTGSYTINFYNKYDQYQKTGVTGEALEQARDVLRLEVQCHPPKLDSIRKKWGFSDKRVINYLDPAIGYEVLRRAVAAVGGAADYRRRTEALNMIDALSCQDVTKARIRKIIIEVATQYASIWKVRDKLVEVGSMDREQFAYCMKIMEEANINAVTISDNTALKGLPLVAGLPNVLGLFDDTYARELYLDAYEPEEQPQAVSMIL